MPVSHRIDITVGGGDRRPAYSSGNVYKSKSSLNEKRIGNDNESITSANLGKVLNIGLAFNIMQRGNEVVGAYTNNRLRQNRINTGMTFAKYGIGFAINPVVGATYMATDLGYRSLMHGIEIQKKNREADYYRRLSGNSASSGRRYRGDWL